MWHIKQIQSTQNPLVKEWFSLAEKQRNRKKKNQFLVEGKREIQLALAGGYRLHTLLFQPEIFPQENIIEFAISKEISVIEISAQVYEKLSYRSSTEGVIGIFEGKNHSVTSVVFNKENPLILIAEAPEKPGNMGALFRTADAAGVDAVFIANPKTDLYNPNVIRSSVGCVFTQQIGVGTSTEIINFLKKHNIQIFCAALSASVSYHLADFQKSSAIVVGTESTGLSQEWLQASTQNIIIPMEGKIDSMNVSVAAAILIFEAKRQRKIK